MLEPLLDYQQAAAELGITTRSIREWVHKGVVPVIRADIMSSLGCRSLPSVKGEGSRIAGKSLVHSRLAP